MFYYFIEFNSNVFEREEEVNLEDYPQFTPLSERELAYYLEHPNATRYEIERAVSDTPQIILERERQAKKGEINSYDSSDYVNGFFIGNRVMWLVPAIRDNYMSTLQGAQRLGITAVTFMGIEMTPETGIMILDMLNIYAMQCVNVTEYHLANVDSLQTLEEIRNYDYRVGYPERLRFFSDTVPEEPEESGNTVTVEPEEPVQPIEPDEPENVETSGGTENTGEESGNTQDVIPEPVETPSGDTGNTGNEGNDEVNESQTPENEGNSGETSENIPQEPEEPSEPETPDEPEVEEVYIPDGTEEVYNPDEHIDPADQEEPNEPEE